MDPQNFGNSRFDFILINNKQYSRLKARNSCCGFGISLAASSAAYRGTMNIHRKTINFSKKIV